MPRASGSPTGQPKATPDGYTVRQLASVLGLTPARIRGFVRSGFLQPAKGPRGEFRFSFQDVVLLRSAEGLSQRLPTRKVRRALRKLRQQLPRGRALAALQIRAEGEEVVAGDGDASWQAESGQVLLQFDVGELAGKVEPLAEAWGRAARAAADRTAEEWFELGVELEACAIDEASAAYRRAIEADPTHADAHINLGRLLHEAGDTTAAESMYRAALRARPDDPIALFNLGVVFDDRGELEAALEAYGRVIELDPRSADAHYNAAQVCERLGDHQAAFRHLRCHHALTHRG